MLNFLINIDLNFFDPTLHFPTLRFHQFLTAKMHDQGKCPYFSVLFAVLRSMAHVTSDRSSQSYLRPLLLIERNLAHLADLQWRLIDHEIAQNHLFFVCGCCGCCFAVFWLVCKRNPGWEDYDCCLPALVMIDG